MFFFYYPPVVREQVIYLNVGGAGLPAVLSLYLLLSGRAPLLPTLFALLVVTIVAKMMARPKPGCLLYTSHYGVEKARCSGGKLVYLTATPTSWMLAQARKSRVDIIKIPARPHGFPLPVPKFLKIAPLQKTRMGYELQRQVLEIAAELLKKAGSRIFLFVPSVALTSLVGEALRSAAGSYPCLLYTSRCV